MPPSRKAIRQPARRIAGDRVDAELDPCAADRFGHPRAQVGTVDQRHVGAECGEMVDQLRAPHHIDGPQTHRLRDLDQADTDRRVRGVLHHPVAGLKIAEALKHEKRRRRVCREQSELDRVRLRQRNEARGRPDEALAPPATLRVHDNDPVTGFEVLHIGAQLRDAAEHACAGEGRQGGRLCVAALEMEQVGRIDGRDLDLDQRPAPGRAPAVPGLQQARPPPKHGQIAKSALPSSDRSLINPDRTCNRIS